MIKSQNYILDFTHVYKDEDIEKLMILTGLTAQT